MQVLVTVAPGSRSVEAADGVEYALSDAESRALGAAVGLRAAHGDIEVVAATVGPPTADPVVRAALAEGADRAIRVWDDRLEPGDLLDTRVTARLLAAVAAEVDPTLVLAGARSGPGGFGVTGVALAARLDYGWATVVTDISLDRDDGVASVRCDRDGDRTELVDVDLPAVLTVGTGYAGPRHASLGAVRAAQRAAVATRSLADLGLDAADIEPGLRRVDTADRDRDVTLFDGVPDDAAADLARVLRARGVEP